MIPGAPTGMEIGVWLGCLFFLVAGADRLMGLIDRFKEKPPARDTYQLKGDYVTRRELDDLAKDLDKLATEIRELKIEIKHDRDAMAAAAEERAAKLHERVNEVVLWLTELRKLKRERQ